MSSGLLHYLSWLRAHAPGTAQTFRPGLRLDELPEGAIGKAALAHLQIADGQDPANRHEFGAPFPQGFLYTYKEVEVEKQLLASVFGVSTDGSAGDAITGGFPDSCFPIAGVDATHVIVDMRGGEWHGLATTWDPVERNYDSPRWGSLDAYFDAVRGAASTGEAFGGFRAVIESGNLRWEVL